MSQEHMACRGVRGATTVAQDSRAAILDATHELLAEIVAANGIDVADVASVIFTATPDLTAAYPAEAARQLGWTNTALLCVQEMTVTGSLPRCIRILVHWNTTQPASRVRHVYLKGAEVLRPDRVSSGESGSGNRAGAAMDERIERRVDGHEFKHPA